MHMLREWAECELPEIWSLACKWEAKAYVADKLSLAVSDLTDPVIMTEVREDLQIGAVTPLPECAKGIEAKFRIAEVLGIDINCVQRFKAKTAL
jgi:dimethylamine--corrinoid protein Co-methyltransferase